MDERIPTSRYKTGGPVPSENTSVAHPNCQDARRVQVVFARNEMKAACQDMDPLLGIIVQIFTSHSQPSYFQAFWRPPVASANRMTADWCGMVDGGAPLV